MSEHNVSSNGHAHEKTDAPTQPIFRFIAALAVFVAIAMVVMSILFTYFSDREISLDSSIAPLAEEAAEQGVGPQLQPNPPTDLTRARLDEEAAIEGYSWVDEPERIVRIPVDRAMELMAERGLPSRPGPPADEEAPLVQGAGSDGDAEESGP